MQPLSDSLIRTSFVNASRREIKEMTLPVGLDSLSDEYWNTLDYLGWRDSKFARRAYVVLPLLDGELVGVMLTQSEAHTRSRALCNWCQDVRLPNDVAFWGAKRVGDAGRRGNTVGTLVCSEFQCSQNVRKAPPLAYVGFDVELARERNIDNLKLKVAGFADMLVTGR